MRVTLRQVLFWPHLVAGLSAGIFIAIMSFTGAALTLEDSVVEGLERDCREVVPPVPTPPRLSIDEVLARVRQARPGAQPSSVTEYPDPGLALSVGLGRGASVYVNPYTGELRDPSATRARAFFDHLEEWHRWLGTSNEHRAVGRALTGASNFVFLLLTQTGLYLWWPRKWTWRTVRPTLWFKRGLQGKARDFNWHNVTGFWLLPLIIVLTATGVFSSFKPVSDLLFTLTGSTPPTAPGPFPATPVPVPPPPAGAQPLGLEPLFATARQQSPSWESLTLRLPVKDAQALTFSVREHGAWPLFASTQVAVDPFTAQVLHRESFGDYGLGRRLRTWIRFLHTGEALGVPGQFVAAITSLGGLLLVWTGFALSWRRFFPRRTRPTSPAPDPDLSPGPSEPMA